MSITLCKINLYTLRIPLKKTFKSIWAPLIIEQLEYWFGYEKYKHGFYKFTEPTKKPNSCYKEGDSWSEVLGISRKLFNKIFDSIGVRYNSETAFRAERDPFKGKLYASYHNRQTHQTYYVRNHNLVQEFLAGLNQAHKPNRNSKAQAMNTLDCENPDYQSISQEAQPPIRNTLASKNLTRSETLPDSGNGLNGHSPTEQTVQPIYIQYNTNNSSSPNQKQLTNKNQEEEENYKKMIEIWKDIIGNTDLLILSSKVIQQLKNTLQQVFNNCLEKWKDYCLKIASSKFLMGEKAGTNFKAWFRWAIKPEAIAQIEQGEFTLGDRSCAVAENIIKAQQQEQTEQLINQQKDLHNQTFHRYLSKQVEVYQYINIFSTISIVDPSTNAGKVLIKAPNNFIKDYIQQRLDHVLEQALKHVFNSQREYQLCL